MTDPQQAAIDAAEDALRADIWDGDPEDIPPTMGREAELRHPGVLDIRFHSFSDGEVIE